MKRLRLICWIIGCIGLIALAAAQTPMHTKTGQLVWRWKYQGVNLNPTNYWRILAYPEHADTTGNAQDTLAYAESPYDTTWTHSPVPYDSYLYVAYNDTLSLSLILREDYMAAGPEAPFGFIHSPGAFCAGVVPPSALNGDSAYVGLAVLGAAEGIFDSLSAATDTLRLSSPVKSESTLTIGAYTLPIADGGAGEVLKTDGAGVLAWAADATGGGSSGASGYALFPVSVDNMHRLYVAGADSGDVVLVSWAPRDGSLPVCSGTGSRMSTIGAICQVADTVYVYYGCSGGANWASGDSCYAWQLIAVE